MMQNKEKLGIEHSRKKVIKTLVIMISLLLLIVAYFIYDESVVPSWGKAIDTIPGSSRYEKLGLDDPSLLLGHRADGMKVFVNPQGAMNFIRKEYSDVIWHLMIRHFLLPLGKWNYNDYQNLSAEIQNVSHEFQLRGGTLSHLLDYYENSFE